MSPAPVESFWDFSLLGIFLLGFVFLGSAIWALSWSRSSGQFEDLERDSRAIFDADEPEGVVQDRFPQ
jgi:cbb3-type cytochrome oxidase maturation protein